MRAAERALEELIAQTAEETTDQHPGREEPSSSDSDDQVGVEALLDTLSGLTDCDLCGGRGGSVNTEGKQVVILPLEEGAQLT